MTRDVLEKLLASGDDTLRGLRDRVFPERVNDFETAGF